MDLVNLANGLTVKVTLIQYAYAPRRWFTVEFALFPTVGKVYNGSEEVLMGFGAQWHDANGPAEKAVVDAFLGKSDTAIRTGILNQWAQYQAGQAYSPQLAALFDYVSSTGIAS